MFSIPLIWFAHINGASGYTMKRALIKSKHTWVLLILGPLTRFKIKSSLRGEGCGADTCFPQNFLSTSAVILKKKTSHIYSVGLFTTSGENEHAALVCMDTVMC